MQPAIKALVQLGPLPRSEIASAAAVKAFQTELAEVKTPVSDEEAEALANLFGPDDCFGLAWSLLHLIETSPNWPLEKVLRTHEGEWIERLRERGA